MATAGAVLNVTYLDAGEAKHTISLTQVDGSADVADVRSFVTALITNGEIFDDEPVSAVKAEIVTTEIRDISLS